MNYIAGPNFNAQRMCGSLCLQHKVNEFLDGYLKERVELSDLVDQEEPMHLSFV